MSVRSLNWLKFGGLVALAFALGLFFAGLVDSPATSEAQRASFDHTDMKTVSAPVLQGGGGVIDLSRGFADVAEAVKPTVVLVESQRSVSATSPRPHGLEDLFGRERGPRFQEGRGSGFVVSADGYILTNNHVVDGADRVIVRLPDRREFEAKVIGADANTDVAVLKIDADRLTPAAMGNSDDTRVGEWVLAIGNPLGETLTFTVTSGIISAKGRGSLGLPGRTQTSIQDFIQTDAAINPGNSGGPLVNLKGEVIGINSAIASETGYNVGYGFAIPINLARNVMNQLIDHGRVRRAALMVSIRDVTPVDAEYAGLDKIQGVLVADIPDQDSPARKAGIRAGDIIISIDGKPVNYVAELQQEIGFRAPGDRVAVELARKGGNRKTVTVRLAELDTEPQLTQVDSGPVDEEDSGTHTIDLLGVTVAPVPEADAEQLGLAASERGLAVVEVKPGGPSWQQLFAGRGGSDIITSVEGSTVHSERDLRQALKKAGPGGIVSLEVVRPTANGTLHRVVRIKLGE